MSLPGRGWRNEMEERCGRRSEKKRAKGNGVKHPTCGSRRSGAFPGRWLCGRDNRAETWESWVGRRTINDDRNRGRPRCIRARRHPPSETSVASYRHHRPWHRRRHPRRDGGSRVAACLIQIARTGSDRSNWQLLPRFVRAFDRFRARIPRDRTSLLSRFAARARARSSVIREKRMIAILGAGRDCVPRARWPISCRSSHATATVTAAWLSSDCRPLTGAVAAQVRLTSRIRQIAPRIDLKRDVNRSFKMRCNESFLISWNNGQRYNSRLLIISDNYRLLSTLNTSSEMESF